MAFMDEPEPSPPPEQPEGPKKLPPLTPAELRSSYLKRAAIVFVISLWFIRDGWFNDDPEMMKHRGFNRSGTVLLSLGVLYCLIMALRNHLAARRGSVPRE